MKRPVSVCVALAVMVGPIQTARAAALQPTLSGLAFLVGQWSAGRGDVADTGGTSAGSSVITVESGGGALLRRDHTDLFDKTGKATGGFDQIMLIYPEGGTLRAEYLDGTHVIHYVTAEVTPGRSVEFQSAATPAAPRFRLAYVLAAPTRLDVSFSMAPPGQDTFRPIATGTLTRAP